MPLGDVTVGDRQVVVATPRDASDEQADAAEQRRIHRAQQARALVDHRRFLRTQRRIERDARSFEQRERRLTAREDEHVVVRDRGLGLAVAVLDAQHDDLGLDAHDVAVEHNAHLAVFNRLLDSLFVARLDARERRLAVAQRHDVARLLAERHGCLDRAVAAADHEDVAAFVALRIEQRVGDLGQLLAGHFELLRRTSTADREHDMARADRAETGRDREHFVLVARDATHLNARLHRQAMPLREAAPDLDELFLEILETIELAMQRQLHGLRHHELLARIRGDRSADRLRLFEAREPQAVLLRCERTRETCRAEADDHEIERRPRSRGIRGFVQVFVRCTNTNASPDRHALRTRHALLRLRRAGLHAARDFGCDDGSVLHCGAHQREARDLTGEEQPGDRDGFVLVVDRRDVLAITQVAERQRDCASGTCIGATAMADATRAVHDDRLPEREIEHTRLRTLAHATAATDALLQVDLRMEQPRLMAALRLRLLPLGEHARVVAKNGAATQKRSDADRHDDGRSGPSEPRHGVATLDNCRAGVDGTSAVAWFDSWSRQTTIGRGSRSHEHCSETPCGARIACAMQEVPKHDATEREP